MATYFVKTDSATTERDKSSFFLLTQSPSQPVPAPTDAGCARLASSLFDTSQHLGLSGGLTPSACAHLLLTLSPTTSSSSSSSSSSSISDLRSSQRSSGSPPKTSKSQAPASAQWLDLLRNSPSQHSWTLSYSPLPFDQHAFDVDKERQPFSFFSSSSSSPSASSLSSSSSLPGFEPLSSSSFSSINDASHSLLVTSGRSWSRYLRASPSHQPALSLSLSPYPTFDPHLVACLRNSRDASPSPRSLLFAPSASSSVLSSSLLFGSLSIPPSIPSPTSTSPISSQSSQSINQSSINQSISSQSINQSSISQSKSSQSKSSQSTSSQPSTTKGRKRSADGVDGTGSIRANKAASRLHAFHALFSRWLPEQRPDFVTEDQWRTWQSDSRSLVVLNRFSSGQVVVTLPLDYDMVVHSYANYGRTMQRCSTVAKTRYRWWSDTSVSLLSPINSVTNGCFVERTAALPVRITNDAYLQSLSATADGRHLLMHELASLFRHALAKILPEDVITNRELSGFGVSRSKSHGKEQLAPETAFEVAVDEAVARWQRRHCDDDDE